MQLENKVIKEIIKRIINAEGHRPYIMGIKSIIYRDFYNEFFSKINEHDSSDDFEKIFIKNEEGKLDLDEIENVLNYSGIPKKTVSDTYFSTSIEAKEKAIKEMGDMIKKNFHDIETSLEAVTFKFDDGSETKFSSIDFFRMVLATSTRYAALGGGFASTMGKNVEKPFILTLCKMFQVKDHNYHALDKTDEGTFTRETDFYFIDNNKKEYRVEFKLMGKGNPEAVDSAYARGVNIFMGDTLSETGKRQCEDLKVHWLELKEEGWQKFGEILDDIGIENSLNKEAIKNLDDVIDGVL